MHNPGLHLRSFLDDGGELSGIKGTHRGGMDVAQSGERHHQAGGGGIVPGLKDDHAIMGTEGPEQMLNLAAALAGGGAKGAGAVWRFMRILEALLGEVEEGDVGGHKEGGAVAPPSKRAAAWRDWA